MLIKGVFGMKSRYDGVVLDGRWKYSRTLKSKYIFVNIFNGNEISLSKPTVDKILSGKTTVSKTMTKRIAKDNRTDWISNNTVKTFNAIKRYHAKKGD